MSYDTNDWDDLTEYGTATWTLAVIPVGASLSSGGQILLPIGISGSGDLWGSAYDDDDPDQGSVSVSLTGGGGGMSAGISVVVSDWADQVLGVSAGGYGVSSDLLGDYLKELELVSTDGTTTHTASASYSHNADFKGVIDAPSLSKTIVYGEVKAYGTSWYHHPWGKQRVDDASVTYTIGSPTYDTSEADYPGPEPGYND